MKLSVDLAISEKDVYVTAANVQNWNETSLKKCDSEYYKKVVKEVLGENHEAYLTNQQAVKLNGPCVVGHLQSGSILKMNENDFVMEYQNLENFELLLKEKISKNETVWVLDTSGNAKSKLLGTGKTIRYNMLYYLKRQFPDYLFAFECNQRYSDYFPSSCIDNFKIKRAKFTPDGETLLNDAPFEFYSDQYQELLGFIYGMNSCDESGSCTDIDLSKYFAKFLNYFLKNRDKKRPQFMRRIKFEGYKCVIEGTATCHSLWNKLQNGIQ